MRRLCRTGFTLIEMTVVLTVAAALFSIALPRASGLIDSIEVRGAVTEIASMLSLARHVAIARGGQVILDIDAPRGVITIRDRSGVIRTREVGTAHGVAMSTNRTSITYSAIGVGYGAANFTLVVSRNRTADSVVVSRLGRVRH
ncbi:MAG: GspH/FimT family pseudopilin [Gemmatimonadales bacterium]